MTIQLPLILELVLCLIGSYMRAVSWPEAVGDGQTYYVDGLTVDINSELARHTR